MTSIKLFRQTYQSMQKALADQSSRVYQDMLIEEAAKRKERETANIKKAIEKLANRRKALKTNTGVVKEVKEDQKYFRESAEQKSLDRTVAMYIGATNAPYSTVNNKYFKIMLQSFQPRYRIPSRSRLIHEISDILQAMKGKIQISMAGARKINFCADIWSKKGLTSSYLGLTAHYYSVTNLCIEHPTLAVRELPHPHTGQAICDLTYQIINEWGIPFSKVQFVITDNGSNMVKAFKFDQDVAVREIDVDDDEFDDESDDESGKEDDDVQLLHGEQLESEGDAVVELNEFETEERTHDTVFTTQGLKRLSCFSHTLQLVLATFNKDPACFNLLSKVYKVVKQVSMSGKVTEALIAETGKKLVSNCVTRWSSAYLVISRLLEVQDKLMIVLVQLQQKITLLQSDEWENLSHIRTLLSKFARYTNVAGGEEYPTLSLVIPTYWELQYHLDEMMKVPFLENVSTILMKELHRRFNRLIDPTDPDHDPVYMIATLLDVRYKLHFTDSQMAHAKKECLRLLGEYETEDDTENEATSGASQPIPDDDDEPAAKRCAYDHVYNTLKKASSIKALKQKDKTLPEKQLDSYLSSTKGLVDLMSDPLSYWINSSHTVVAPLAIDLLSAPSSSAPVERTFSAAGIATSGRRNRLAKENLEKEVLLKKNEQYFAHIY